MNHQTYSQGAASDRRREARDRMRQIAAETVEIAKSGVLVCRGEEIEINEAQRHTEEDSVLITPERGLELLRQQSERLQAGEEDSRPQGRTDYLVVNQSAVRAIRDLNAEGVKHIGVLNFASAKNAGGGFLNGAMAQEEALAASSGLYPSQLKHPNYYKSNRASGTMMYTHHAIYSPDVVFFRNENFELSLPLTYASVLTLPAVNYGEVLRQVEDSVRAKAVMLERMRLALAIFAERGDRSLVLGAYGCGVFGNDPAEVADWWRRLLDGEGWAVHFDRVTFAVLDRTKDSRALRPFERIWGRAR
ncbi:TIGR02452 family protein [Saccharibacillus sp. O16]|nr:TIGR02452 family protein [Saccharibacillus sp. O16]